MPSAILPNMVKYQSATIGKRVLKEGLFVHQDYNILGAYFLRDELRRLVETTIKVIINRPEVIEKVHSQTIKFNVDYFDYAQGLLKINFKKLSNNDLASVYDKLLMHQQKSHGYSQLTTWFVDSDGEDFSRFLLDKAKEIIKKEKSNLSPAEVFSILTTPEKQSFAAKEEIESLRVLQSINRNAIAKKVFLGNNTEEISNNFKKIDKKLKNKIINHYKKWHWAPFTYIGPAYDLNYYLEVWSGLLRQGFNISDRLKYLVHQSEIVRKQKEAIIIKLNIDSKPQKLFKIAADIIYIKSFRKDCLYYGMYVLDKIMREISFRLNISLKQVGFLAFYEVAPALKKGYFSVDILNERIKFSIIYQKGDKQLIYSGERAKNFLAKLNLEKEKMVKVDHLEGTCACPGFVKGTVKIVNLPEEKSKMNQGDIMVAHTTFPALVPAMKKAAAIVTDDGGVTCHAAIVARESKTPCVVGTKFATKILKDGDKIEVDANLGIVRKI
jgi:phosphohistidine swiveling domain-containing protein